MVKKKLIEVALPLDAINKASAREKSIRHGHPSTLHLWWARRPLAAARAVIFSQMVDDPSGYVDVLRGDPKLRRKAETALKARLKLWEEAKALARKAEGTGLSVPEPGPAPTLDDVLADQERQRLFRIIEDLVLWENTTNETVLQAARDEIWQSWRRACAENADHPRAKELFDRNKLPAFHDPFAGGGALPLEAQRLGLEAYASDLNPVAVLINKAMIEIPPKFAGKPPVNPKARSEWGGVRSELGDDDALSGSDRLEKGDGSRSGGISLGPSAPEGGNLRHAFADYSGDSLHTSEHRGGLDTGVGSGEGAVPGDRAGILGGGGYAADIVRAGGMVPGDRDRNAQAPSGRSEPDANDSTAQVQNALTLAPHSSALFPRQWKGAQGLAEDVRYYGQWMRDEAEKRIGHLYPKIEITAEMAKERPDLKPYVGRKLTVIAWLWARTVKSPNPAFAQVDVPLASTFMLSTKAGKEAYVEPVIEDGGYGFTVKVGKPKDAEGAKNGTKLSRGANFQCLMSGTPIAGDYIKAEGKAGRMGARMMTIVAEGDRGRVFLPPMVEHEVVARAAKSEWKPEGAFIEDARAFTPCIYGIKQWEHLFTERQLAALTTFTDLISEVRERIKGDGLATGLSDDHKPLGEGGTSAMAYADAVGVYLAFALDRVVDRHTSIATWDSSPSKLQLRNTFARQAIPMTWDFGEGNPLCMSSGTWTPSVEWVSKAIDFLPAARNSNAIQADASSQAISFHRIVSTDPPYYDNVPYADLSDFFYSWLRPSLRPVFPDLFATLAVPKVEELVAFAYRHNGAKVAAEAFFLDGMTQAMHRLSEQTHPAYPVTIFYAFKQAENDTDAGTASTGWETFLDAVIRAGFATSGTWPMRTELGNRMRSMDSNALASSIILVCRKREASAPTATRREFITALKSELPQALAHLQHGNIAPVDLAQAAIGPGMAVYTRYAKVLDAEGKPLSVREALALINQTLDEALAEQEGDFDADSRWAITWFEENGFSEGEYGRAEQLSKSKNTSVEGMKQAGILESKGGRVRLLKPDELAADWDPNADSRLSAWETVHQLVRALEAGGDSAAAGLVTKLGAKAEIARELAYRLYVLCERKKRAAEALSYNALVQSWPEISRLAQQSAASPTQAGLFA